MTARCEKAALARNQRCTAIEKTIPNDCPSFQYYAKGHLEESTPVMVLSVKNMDELLGKLIGMAGENRNTAEVLSTVLRESAWNYTEATRGMGWKEATQQLPLNSVCNSLTVSQQSELSIQFSHHIGLSLKSTASVEEFLLNAYAVRIMGPCNIYEKEQLMLDATNFITRLDFLRHATFNPGKLANIVVELHGEYHHVMEWYPKLISRTKLLFHPSTSSNYYRYLTNGLIQFSQGNCTLRMLSRERLKEQILKNPNQFMAQLMKDYYTGSIPKPPYDIVKNAPKAYWKNNFGSNHTAVRELMLSSYAQHTTLATNEAIKLAILINNQQYSRSSPGDFELILRSITAAGNLKSYVAKTRSLTLPDRSLDPTAFNITEPTDTHSLRTKRSPVFFIFSSAMRLLTRMGQRLLAFFRGWTPAIVGSPLGRAVQRVHTSLQGSARGFSSQIRTEHSLKQILGHMGPAQRVLVPFVRSRSLGNLPQQVRQLQFGPNRYSSLQLPSPIKRQLSMFSPERLRLRQRALDMYAWSKKNILFLGSTAATVGLFALSMDTIANERYENYYNFSDNPWDDGPHVVQAVKSWYAIANGSFYLYEPMTTTLTPEQQRSLQADVFGNKTQGNGNATRADLYDSALAEAYRSEGINIYDISLSVEVRRSYLLKLRSNNQILRELDSMTFAAARYVEESPTHKKAVEAAEMFFGLLMTSYQTILPTEQFMDSLLRNYIRDGDHNALIEEVHNYVDLTFMQLQDQWTPEMREKFAMTAEGLQNHFSNQDIEAFKKTTDPNARAAFELMLRKQGKEQLHVFNKQMDFLLGAESERLFWKQNYGSHRLLYANAPFEVPNKNQDYLATLFWFQLYFAQEGKQKEVDDFILAMSRLGMIRLYDENRACGLPTEYLKAKISPQDLAIIETSGLPGIADTKASDWLDSATFTDYDSLLSLANSNGSLVEFSPDIGDYANDEDNLLTNELVGLNNVKDVISEESSPRGKRSLSSKQRQKIFQAKEFARRILGNLTLDSDLQKELELFAIYPSRSRLFMKRMKRETLTHRDLLDLETSQTEGTDMQHLEEAQAAYLASAQRYSREQEIPGEILALLLSPQQGNDLTDSARAKLQTAHRVMKIQPLPSLVEKQILLSYLRRIHPGKTAALADTIFVKRNAPLLILVTFFVCTNALLLCALNRKKTKGKAVEEHITQNQEKEQENML